MTSVFPIPDSFKISKEAVSGAYVSNVVNGRLSTSFHFDIGTAKPMKYVRGQMEKVLKKRVEDKAIRDALLTGFLNSIKDEILSSTQGRFYKLYKINDLRKDDLATIIDINEGSCFRTGGAWSGSQKALKHFDARVAVGWVGEEAGDLDDAIGRIWIIHHEDAKRVDLFNTYDFGGLDRKFLQSQIQALFMDKTLQNHTKVYGRRIHDLYYEKIYINTGYGSWSMELK